MIKTLYWLHDCGSECPRCGAPRAHWVIRKVADPLNWKIVKQPKDLTQLHPPAPPMGDDPNHSGPGRPRKNVPYVAPEGWRLSLVTLDHTGTWCQECVKREDRFVGLAGYPHSLKEGV